MRARARWLTHTSSCRKTSAGSKKSDIMKTSFTLLLCHASLFSALCGTIPSFSAKEDGRRLSVSVHKRSVDQSGEYPDTSSAMFEKYDKWTGPGAITSQEVRELKKKGQWMEQTEGPKRGRGQKESSRRRRRELQTDESPEWQDNSNLPFEQGDVESSEDDFAETFKNAFISTESNSQENVSVSTSSDTSSTHNASDVATTENLETVNPEHLKDDIIDDDESVCAVNKDDEEATRVVTIFWRSVFCVIFVIIVVYPIYSYTRVYCQKRRKYAESISNDRFAGSDSEISNISDDLTPTSMTPTPTAN